LRGSSARQLPGVVVGVGHASATVTHTRLQAVTSALSYNTPSSGKNVWKNLVELRGKPSTFSRENYRASARFGALYNKSFIPSTSSALIFEFYQK
jgi:hypothetical protein